MTARIGIPCEENVKKFDLNNVTIVESLENGIPDKLPVPDIAFIVGSPRIGSEIKALLSINPVMDFVIYTLHFEVLMSLPAVFRRAAWSELEAIQVADPC